jgi:hypothetical protein
MACHINSTTVHAYRASTTLVNKTSKKYFTEQLFLTQIPDLKSRKVQVGLPLRLLSRPEKDQ